MKKETRVLMETLPNGFELHRDENSFFFKKSGKIREIIVSETKGKSTKHTCFPQLSIIRNKENEIVGYEVYLEKHNNIFLDTNLKHFPFEDRGGLTYTPFFKTNNGITSAVKPTNTLKNVG